MPCFFPIQGFRARHKNPSGKYGIVFNANSGYVDQPVTIPCGRCIGCKLEYSRQWAIRCLHEASCWDNNCFITLTYDDKHLPPGNTLVKKDFQDFMKRLRFKYGEGVRYFHCGEYGEQYGRPHYHALLFNFDFNDRVLYKRGDSGSSIFTSEALSLLWTKGFSTVGDVTFESAAYCARYVVKKITGDLAKEHYTYIDTNTGEFYERLPEYTTMSRGGRGANNLGGIGMPWLRKYKSDVFPDDFVVVRGIKMKPPKYYTRQFQIDDELEAQRIARERKIKAFRRREHNTPERLRVREVIARAKLGQLKRSVEDG